jgi:hypothetical protein
MLLEGDAAQVKDHGRLGLLLYAAEVVGTDAGRSDEFLDTEGSISLAAPTKVLFSTPKPPATRLFTWVGPPQIRCRPLSRARAYG